MAKNNKKKTTVKKKASPKGLTQKQKDAIITPKQLASVKAASKRIAGGVGARRKKAGRLTSVEAKAAVDRLTASMKKKPKKRVSNPNKRKK